MAKLSLSDAPCKSRTLGYRARIDSVLDSDVAPCVWAAVEVCLGVLSACLPTYPALFRWKSVRAQQRGSGMPHSGSDSSQYAVLTSDKARLESLRMTDWADVPKTLDKGHGK